MCSLVMDLFSCDYIKVEIDSLRYQQCFNLLKCIQYSNSAWFLDGRTSLLVTTYNSHYKKYKLYFNNTFPPGL